MNDNDGNEIIMVLLCTRNVGHNRNGGNEIIMVLLCTRNMGHVKSLGDVTGIEFCLYADKPESNCVQTVHRECKFIDDDDNDIIG